MGRPCSVAKVTAARSAAEPLHSLRQQEEVEFEPIRHFEFFKHMKQVVLDRMLAESELIAICLLLSLSKSILRVDATTLTMAAVVQRTPDG